ncbi:nucleoside diphosphate-linked moiety X motif 17-like isoform X2 [Melanerpes formicivorus]|uniref:nucleoside diphosphate-linked moiety X motif 17-like isoform X2 n=1 Tax=Melanerpes formicivorus TaxID=211600 RepID=UPI00358E73E4
MPITVPQAVPIVVPITVPEWCPSWCPSHCQGGAHPGAHHSATGGAHHGAHPGAHHSARAVPIVVPTSVPRWWPSRWSLPCAGSAHPALAVPTLPPSPAPQSVTGTFCPPDSDSAPLSCGLRRGRFLLSDEAFPGSTTTVLERSPFCPAKRLGQRPELRLPAELRGRGVAAGVAALLGASSGRLLLTRRAPGLSFPNLWVPPGGHLEPDEELLAAALRELEEEAGLRLPAGTFSCRMLGLWESLYPPKLSLGLPRHHHIVAYLLLLSSESQRQLEAEVSAYAWLEPSLLAAIAASEQGAQRPRPVPGSLPGTVGITELSRGSRSSLRVPTETFLRAAPAAGADVERVSSGTKFALRRWQLLGAAAPPLAQ